MTFEKVYVAVNLKQGSFIGFHWITVVLDIKLRKVIHYDSIPEKYKNKGYAAAALIRDSFAEIYSDIADYQITCGSNIPTQTNSVDCGAFVASFIAKDSMQLPLDYAESDMQESRLRMAGCILKRNV